MKRSHCVVACVVAVVLGFVLGGFLLEEPAVAQGNGAPAAGRYQVSSYAVVYGNSIQQGYYILDTATGQLWHANHGGTPAKVLAKLP